MPESVGLEWYDTGTVTLTQGSTAVTGVGTNWLATGIKTGDIFTVDRSTLYMVLTVNSDTSLTLKQAYAGASGNTLNYYILRNFAATLQSELSAQITKQNAIYQTWLNGRITEVGIPFDFSSLYKTTWATGRQYKALDIVMYNSALYVCVVAHTSSSSITPTNTQYWLSYAPAMPAGVDIFNYNNAGTHNVPRGKNLGSSFTTAQSTAIRNGTFTDIYVGDYWTVSGLSYTYTDEDGNSQTATYSGTLRVIDIDYYLKGGDTALNTHHIVVMPDANMFTAPMNATNTTEGGYVNSKMRTVYLARARAIFEAFFESSHVLTYRDYLVNAVTSGRPSGGAWMDCRVELADERQTYGSCVFDSGASDGTNVYIRYTVSCKQFNLFRHWPDMISNRQWFYLRNVVSSSSFANVSGYGNCTNDDAGDSDGGVRPFALVA
ncbi:MAG: hypothetical protein IJT79_01500 [Ruminococcus sp.]|nr:hypothetical protein [Ruminococcus sp.]